MIKIDNLIKYYGQNKAIDNISFEVKTGEILGLLGPNGAGKTTIMNIITGYLYPTDGKVEIDGNNVHDGFFPAKNKIGYLPEQPPLYPEMLVKDFLTFVARIKGVAPSEIKNNVAKAIKTTSLDQVKHRLISNLSKGYKQRVGLAQALINDPSFLILDEPTVGLDPQQIIDIRSLITKLAKDRTIILSSHILSEVSTLCERVVIIDKGRIVATDSQDKLTRKVSDVKQIFIEIEANDDKKPIDIFLDIENINKVDKQASKTKGKEAYLIETPVNEDIRPLLYECCVKNNWIIYELTTLDASLEDVYLKLTS